MPLRYLKLNDLFAEVVGFSVLVDGLFLERMASVRGIEEDQENLFGHHEYTAGGQNYQVLVAGFPHHEHPFFSIRLGQPMSLKKPTVTRDRFVGLVEDALSVTPNSRTLATGTFLFPEDRYETTLARLPGADRELRFDWGLDDEPSLVRAGIRYKAAEGADGVLVDWSQGPIRVDLTLTWKPIKDFTRLRHEVRELAAVAKRFVEPREQAAEKAR